MTHYQTYASYTYGAANKIANQEKHDNFESKPFKKTCQTMIRSKCIMDPYRTETIAGEREIKERWCDANQSALICQPRPALPQLYIIPIPGALHCILHGKFYKQQNKFQDWVSIIQSVHYKLKHPLAAVSKVSCIPSCGAVTTV